MRGLYAIVDLDFLASRGVAALDFAERVLPARPAALQLRAKSSTARDTLALLGALRIRCADAGVPLFANDRPDLALLAGCSGVHLGQSDLSLEDASRVAPGLAIGLSTHSLAELERALQQRPAYVAFGPVFSTLSKRNAEAVVGLEQLSQARRLCRVAGVPLVAIGGLTLERAAEVALSADAGAVISGLWPATGLADVELVAKRWHAAFGGG